MQSPSIPKPWIVKATIAGLGVLAFLSVAACRSIHEQLPAQAVASILQVLAANVAFLGVLTGTRLGRRAAITVLALIAVSGLFGVFVGLRSIASAPVVGASAITLSIGFILWFWAYAFGTSARRYYSALWADMRASTSA